MPGAPASRALSEGSATIWVGLRLGKACAISAIAPVICGAEKDVPDQRRGVLVWSGARTSSPTAARKKFLALPARFEKLEITPLASTDPATMMRPCGTEPLAAGSAKASGLGSPSLPAAMTRITPAAVAWVIAVVSVLLGADPPSEMLTTFTPAVRAVLRAVAIERSSNWQPLSGSL